MSEPVDWTEITALLQSLYAITDRLEFLFPGRKFTPDGHLIGSIGEVVAAYMFDLDLQRGSNRAFDAITSDNRQVEVKLTQGDVVAIRHESEHLIVLQRPRREYLQVVFNGPGALAWNNSGKLGANGQKQISLKVLRALDLELPDSARLPMKRVAPI